MSRAALQVCRALLLNNMLLVLVICVLKRVKLVVDENCVVRCRVLVTPLLRSTVRARAARGQGTGGRAGQWPG